MCKLLLLMIVFFPTVLCAQTFVEKHRYPLSAPSPKQLQWIDADNDSLLDVVVSDTTTGFDLWGYAGFVKDSVSGSRMIRLPSGQKSFATADIDLDTRTDLVIVGNDVEYYANAGKFHFTNIPSGVISPGARKLQYADLNNDGLKESILLNTDGSWSVQKNSHHGFTSAIDSAKDKASDFYVFDFDSNTISDIAISSKNKSGTPVLRVIQLKDNIALLHNIVIPATVSGMLAAGDLNHDGRFDLIVSGINASGTWVTESWINHDSLFVKGRQYFGVHPNRIEIADFNSNGLSDVAMFGKDSLGNSVHIINGDDGSKTSLPSAGVLDAAFGDYDRDGDLDLMQLSSTGELILLENKSGPNKGPLPPAVTPVVIYNRVFFFWDPVSDDHTAKKVISYDITVFHNNAGVVTGQFDLKNQNRTTVSHGNLSQVNFALLKVPVTDGGTYQVQSIDNAYQTLKAASGLCGGSGSCSLVMKTLSICDSTTVTVKSPDPVYWFSFANGFVNFGPSTKVKAATDTIFSFKPVPGSCPAITIYRVATAKDTLRQSASVIGCEGTLALLTIDDQWLSAVWKNKNVQVATGNAYAFPIADATLTTFAVNSEHCKLKKIWKVSLSKPDAKVDPEEISIYAGQIVQLHASGGVQYTWSPADGTYQPDIANPSVSPIINTTYIVTVTDSLGCTATDTARIQIVPRAYLATLFSPNGDSKNDELKVYGLSHANNFRLSIYNREGAIVYETTDISAATGEGWNGAHNGAQQPGGIYYWKVEGINDAGRPLELNGKKQGSIMLVR